MPDVDYTQMFEELARRFKPGGIVEAGQLADIEAGKRQAIGRGTQQLVSSGLAGTTVAAGVPIAAEEVAGRARLGVRGKTAAQLSTLELAMASLLEKARLTEAQLAQQRDIASGQLRFGYAGLRQQEEEATRGLDIFGRPMRGTEAYARIQALQRQGQAGGAGAGGGYGTDYGGTGGGYGGYTGGRGYGAGGAYQPGQTPTSTQQAVQQAGGYPWQEDFGAYIGQEEYEYWMGGGATTPAGGLDQQIGMREADPSMVPAGVTGGVDGPMSIFAQRHERQQEIAKIKAARGY